MKKSFLVLCVITAGALAACSSPNADWQKATQQNTVVAYQSFIKEHPSDARVEQARNRINALTDEQAWSAAKSADTLDAYQQYLQQEPNGMHAADAQDKVNSLQQSAAWQTAQSTNTTESYQDFLSKYPNAPQGDQAKAALKKLTGYQAVLAVVHTQAYGEKLAKTLKSKFGNELQDVVVVPHGKLFELRSAPMTESQVKTACEKVRKAHYRCDVEKSVS